VRRPAIIAFPAAALQQDRKTSVRDQTGWHGCSRFDACLDSQVTKRPGSPDAPVLAAG
jgi:hypothetical protein